MNRSRRSIALIASVLALAAAQVRAQETPATAPAPATSAAPAAAPAGPEPPAAIPTPEIVGRSEQLKAELRQIEARSAPDPTEIEVETQLPVLSGKLVERSARADELLASPVSLDALSDLAGEWRARADRLTAWRQALTRRALAVETEIDNLEITETQWERTREAAAAAALPPSTRDRIEETLQAVNATQKTIKRRRTHILKLQNDVAEQELVVSGVLDRTATLRKELQSRLFARDEPPLWSPDSYVRAADAAPVPERLSATWAENLDELREYVRLHANRFPVQASVFFLVLVALLLARPRVQLWAVEDPTLAATARIFTRPYSAALVVSTIGAQFASPDAPSVVVDLEALVLVVPILRLLPQELYGSLRYAVIGLALLFVVGTLRSLSSDVPVIERYRLLLEALGGVALFAYILRPERAQNLAGFARFGAAILPIVRAALVVLVVAALANVIGMLSVSRLLVRGTLTSLFGAVATYSLARIAAGAVTTLLRSGALRHLRLVRDHGALVRRRIVNGLYLIAVAGWVVATLRFFTIQDEVFGTISGVVGAQVEFGTVSISLGEVLAFFVTVWLAFTLSRFVRFVLDEDVLPHIALPRGVPAAISTGVHYVILLFGFVLAIGAAGIDLSRFSLLAGAFGVGIGFGLQNVVNNFVSGLILLFERPVQTGDTIAVGELTGEVRRIGIRSSTVRTFEGADVIVPNASLISERVVNWTFSDRQRRVDLDVGVAYGTDPEKVIGLLVAVGRAHPEVLEIPEPVALFTRFGESSLDFSLRVWTRFEIYPRVKSEIGIAMNTALRDAGIEIPFPQRDMNVKVAPGAPEILLPGNPELG